MNGIHDCGGRDGYGPIDIDPEQPIFHADWERRMFGMFILAFKSFHHRPTGCVSNAASEHQHRKANRFPGMRRFGRSACGLNACGAKLFRLADDRRWAAGVTASCRRQHVEADINGAGAEAGFAIAQIIFPDPLE